jgi:hypothetical protein
MLVLYLILIAIGLLMIAVGIFRWAPWFYNVESQFVEMIGGESMVRWYWGLGGVLLIISTTTQWIWGWGF